MTKHVKSGTFRMSNLIVQDPTITPNQSRIICLYASFRGFKQVYYSVENLSQFASMSESTLKRVRKSLMDRGYLKCTRSDKYNKNIYELTDKCMRIYQAIVDDEGHYHEGSERDAHGSDEYLQGSERPAGKVRETYDEGSERPPIYEKKEKIKEKIEQLDLNNKTLPYQIKIGDSFMTRDKFFQLFNEKYKNLPSEQYDLLLKLEEGLTEMKGLTG